MSNFKHATYCGPTEKLQGKTALVRDNPMNPSGVLAQFDEPLYIGTANLACGWHEFARSSFNIDRSIDEG